MAAEEEIRRMVVRLYGDDGPYRRMLKDSAQQAEDWSNQINKIMDERARKTELAGLRMSQAMKKLFSRQNTLSPEAFSDAKRIIELQFQGAIGAIDNTAISGLRRIEEHANRVQQVTRRLNSGLGGGLKLGAGLLLGGGALAAGHTLIREIRESWKLVADETDNAIAATHNYSSATVDGIERAKSSLNDFKQDLTSFKRDIGSALAPIVEGGASAGSTGLGGLRAARMGFGAGFAGIFGGVDARTAFIEDEGRRIQQQRAALSPEELKEQEFRAKTIEEAMQGQRDAIQDLKVDLGEITEEEAAWNDLLKQAGNSADRIGAQHREALQTLVKQRVELEKQIKVQKEKEQEERRAAREKQRQIEQDVRETARFQERRDKENQKRRMEDAQRAVQLGMVNADRQNILRQIQAVQLSGAPISAGAAIEAGSVEARSLTKFGTGQDRIADLLKKLEALDREALQLQKRSTDALEGIEASATTIVTIA